MSEFIKVEIVGGRLKEPLWINLRDSPNILLISQNEVIINNEFRLVVQAARWMQRNVLIIFQCHVLACFLLQYCCLHEETR